MEHNQMPHISSPPWSNRTKRLVILVCGGLLFLLWLQLLQIWTIVIIAVLIAYLLNPIVNFFDHHILRRIPFDSLRRSLAVLLTLLSVILVLVAVGILIVPPLAIQMQQFVVQIPDLVDSYERQLEDTLSYPISFGQSEVILWDEIQAWVGASENDVANSPAFGDAIRDAAFALSRPVVGIATLAVSLVFNFLFTLVILFYLMRDGSGFVNSIIKNAPPSYKADIKRLALELQRIWNAYLRGQILLGIIVGVTTGISASILGLPQPLVLGLLAGFLEFIPNIGPLLASVPGVLFALVFPSTTIPALQGIPFAIAVAIMYVIIQQGESLFLVPRVMGQSLDLHPVAILIAVLSGAAIGGILGIILAAPVLATMRLFFIYIWGKLTDTDPFAQRASFSMGYAASTHAPSLGKTPAPALNSPPFPEHSGEIVEE